MDDAKHNEAGAPETLILTASIKPFINLVWGGTIVMVLGFYFALLTRYRRIKSETRKFEHLNNGNNGNGHNGNGKAHNNKKHKKEEEEIA